jgi:transposase-like protein
MLFNITILVEDRNCYKKLRELRPHRGISQEKMPYYLAFFEFSHSIRKRGQAALQSLIGLLVAT